MTKKVILLTAVLVFALAATAMAAGTATLNVTATVQAICTVAGSPGTIDFGSIDPSNPGPIAGVVTSPTVTCTNGTAFTVDKTANTYTLDDGGGNTFTYTVSGEIVDGNGTGAPVAILTGASVTQAQYGTAPAGAYTDTLTYDFLP
jgi:spore coat protein U-like protein